MRARQWAGRDESLCARVEHVQLRRLHKSAMRQVDYGNGQYYVIARNACAPCTLLICPSELFIALIRCRCFAGLNNLYLPRFLLTSADGQVVAGRQECKYAHTHDSHILVLAWLGQRMYRGYATGVSSRFLSLRPFVTCICGTVYTLDPAAGCGKVTVRGAFY